MSFDDRLAKGKIGENIVDEYLIKKGFVPYRPIEGIRHPFDRLVASSDKRRILVVEVKSKPRREAYADTGIPKKHYEDYQHIYFSYNIPVFIAFVDEKLAQIYGNFLSEFLKRDGRYPWEQNGIVYFPLASMKTIATLTAEQCAELAALRKTRWNSAEHFGIKAESIEGGFSWENWSKNRK